MAVLLHLCPDCDSDLVYPTSWQEFEPGLWEVDLRCPSCEWSHTGEYGQADVERFDDELNRGSEQLLVDLGRLVRANLEEDIDRFAGALAADHVLPEDF